MQGCCWYANDFSATHSQIHRRTSSLSSVGRVFQFPIAVLNRCRSGIAGAVESGLLRRRRLSRTDTGLRTPTVNQKSGPPVAAIVRPADHPSRIAA